MSGGLLEAREDGGSPRVDSKSPGADGERSGANKIGVTGAPCRKTDPKIATAPKTQSRSKDENKKKGNSK